MTGSFKRHLIYCLPMHHWWRPLCLSQQSIQQSVQQHPRQSVHQRPVRRAQLRWGKVQFQDEVSLSLSLDSVSHFFGLKACSLQMKWLSSYGSQWHAKNYFGRIRAIISSYCQCVSPPQWQEHSLTPKTPFVDRLLNGHLFTALSCWLGRQ